MLYEKKPRIQWFQLWTAIIIAVVIGSIVFMMVWSLTRGQRGADDAATADLTEPSETTYELYLIRRIDALGYQSVDVICLNGYQYALFRNVGVVELYDKDRWRLSCPRRSGVAEAP